MIKLSFPIRIYLTVVISSVIACTPLFLINELTLGQSLGIMIGLQLTGFLVAKLILKDYKKGIESLETGLLNIKDGEYSTTLADDGSDEFSDLCRLYNETVDKLRAEKHWLYQRELLLDKVTQSSPSVLILVNDYGQVVFSNLAARDFVGAKQALEGQNLQVLLESMPIGCQQIMAQTKDGLFSIQTASGEHETWHISNGEFRLNNQPHRLIILKQLTRELSRQEVSVWKKVIRIISHELNNSLGPIASMLHSGQIIADRIEEEKLVRVFSTIEERINHLSDFVQGYGKFAKLPEPKISTVKWQPLISRLKEQWQFSDPVTPAEITLNADPMQLEQLLINLLKNAHESGSPPQLVELGLSNEAGSAIIEVCDRGTGMSDTVLNSALIPFYSTKATGSGLGLALCREIVDAHQGQISLRNREDGGLCVKISLPH